MLSLYSAKLVKKELLSGSTYVFSFQLLNDQELNFTAGQYLIFTINDLPRLYSIASSPSKKKLIELIVDLSPGGVGTTYLKNLSLNDNVEFKAPAGVFVAQKTTTPKIFLATGTGVAPMKSMILDLLEKGFSEPLTLIWGLKYQTDIYLDSFFRELKQKYPNFNYLYCLSRPLSNYSLLTTNYFSGHLQNVLAAFKEKNLDLSKFEYYLCGKPQIVEDLKKTLTEQFQISAKQIFHEKFT